ncbi:MAG: HIT domain-containing protein, partial [Pseudomonadota bacterium]
LRAKRLLNEVDENTKAPHGRCANCGSDKLSRVRDIRIILLTSLTLNLFPFAPSTRQLRCRACGHKQFNATEGNQNEESQTMSVTPPYDPDNIFTKIINGDLPSAKIYEDDEILAFMDAFPQSKGHTLVISKTAQATHLLDMPPDQLSNLIQHTQRIAKAVVAGLKPDGFRIVQFNGGPAGQTVFHLHFHIIPVWEDHKLGKHASGGQATIEDLQPVAEIISAHL